MADPLLLPIPEEDLDEVQTWANQRGIMLESHAAQGWAGNLDNHIRYMNVRFVHDADELRYGDDLRDLFRHMYTAYFGPLIPVSTIVPLNPPEGSQYYNTTSQTVQVYVNGQWLTVTI